jgi:hypothetical protein
MPNPTKQLKKANVNPNVSEYIWDLKTRRYKRNPDYRAARTTAHYILWGAGVLIMLIAIVWCLRWV